MTLCDMIEHGIAIQGRFVSIIDCDDNTVYYGEGEALAHRLDELWMMQEVAYIYPSIYEPNSLFIELR